MLEKGGKDCGKKRFTEAFCFDVFSQRHFARKRSNIPVKGG
jgi:hypothetical protein